MLSFMMYIAIAVSAALLGRETSSKSLESIEREIEAQHA